MNRLWVIIMACAVGMSMMFSCKSGFEKGLGEIKRLEADGLYEDVIIRSQKLLKKFPTEARIYMHRGRAYLMLKKHREAMKDFARCKSYDRSFAGCINGIGNVYLQKKMFGLAIDNYTMALKLSGDNTEIAQIYHNMGLCNTRMKRYDNAISLYQKAVKADDAGYIYVNYGRAWAMKGNRDKALEVWLTGTGKKFSEKKFQAFLYNNIMMAFYQKKDFVKAMQYAKKSLKLFPDDENIMKIYLRIKGKAEL